MSALHDSVHIAAAVDAALLVEAQRGERVFVVGGVVRDLVMQRAPGDFDLDLVVEGDAIAFARDVSQVVGGVLREHVTFLTAKIQAPFAHQGESTSQRATGLRPLTEIDFASARTESYPSPGALPVVTPASIERDLWRRDFSINALAVPLSVVAPLWSSGGAQSFELDSVIDPTGGRRDIAHNTLRVLHKVSFVDDPSRLFRAVRYAERLHFDFDLETLAAFMEAVKSGALSTLSPRRLLNEVLVALDEPAPSRVLEEFLERGLFFQLPIVSERNEEFVCGALSRLEVNRASFSADDFKQAGRLIILAGLLHDGREDIALAAHEGGKVISAARRVLGQECKAKGHSGLAELLAFYCVHGTVEARILLEEMLQGGEE